MALGGSSLSSFVIRQKDHFFRRKVRPERAVNALADAFIEDLHREVPGPNAHPNATGNLLDSLTARSEVNTTGYLWWVGVGDMARLGKPGEKAYKPRPIKRFLDWYLEREEAKHEERRKRQQELAAERAARARQREEYKKQRLAIQDRADWGRYVQSQIDKTERLIHRLREEAGRVERSILRMTGFISSYDDYFARDEFATGRWDISKKSYQRKLRARQKLRDRVAKAYERLAELDRRMMVYEEGLERYRQRYQ
ncbi:MAG: hypothetical protein GWN93_05790 [Deltaproteobacteria bacterium]|nr:hypothetical protein [Deltaproteobacteria bacterium]